MADPGQRLSGAGEVLRIQGLNAWYGESHVLHGVNFAVNKGEVVTLLGRNGSGRTSTLRSIMGLVGRRTGSITVNGAETIAMSTHKIAHLGLGYCPEERAMQLLERVGLTQFARLTAGELAYGRKRTLEIATTLAMDPELMLLDEPTAGMGHEDVDRVRDLIKEVAAGRTVLMVEHNMSVVSGICDTITVLQRGSVLAEGSYAEVSANPAVMEAYMGTAHG